MLLAEELEVTRLLLEEMRNTNVRRGLKLIVHEDWCRRLEGICRGLEVLCQVDEVTT